MNMLQNAVFGSSGKNDTSEEYVKQVDENEKIATELFRKTIGVELQFEH